MSAEITIQISERVVNQATQVAAQSQRRIEDVLAGWLEQAITDLPVDALPDEEVLALTELQLTSNQQRTLSDLLTRNRENTLQPKERHQLDELIHTYEHGLLRKAQALRTAVQRGLREPLQL